jgi:ABC-type Zn2+ transport system substrate-binding protein/surface adhesin
MTMVDVVEFFVASVLIDEDNANSLALGDYDHDHDHDYDHDHDHDHRRFFGVLLVFVSYCSYDKQA